MNEISVTNDIIPVGKFKAGLALYLRELHKNQNALIITQNGKPAGVLISPEEFDELRYTQRFVKSVTEGLNDAEKGNVMSEVDARKLLKLPARQ